MNYVQRINKIKPQCILLIQAFKSSVQESSCWEFIDLFFLIWTNCPTSVMPPKIPKGGGNDSWAWIALSAGDAVLTHHGWGHWAQLKLAGDSTEPIPLRITRVICSPWHLWDTGFKAQKVRNLCSLWLAAGAGHCWDHGTAWHMPRQLFVLAQALPGRH